MNVSFPKSNTGLTDEFVELVEFMFGNGIVSSMHVIVYDDTEFTVVSDE